MKSGKIAKIACIGEVMIELIPDGQGGAQLDVAGDSFNTAVYLRRSLAPEDFSIAYLTVLGDDYFSNFIIDKVNQYQLDASYIERLAGGKPGIYAIETEANGERHFTYWRSDSAARQLFSSTSQLKLTALHEFDLIFLSAISLAILPAEVVKQLLASLAELRAQGTLIAFDSNYRPHLWPGARVARETIVSMWRSTDIALPSLDDEARLFGLSPDFEARHEHLQRLVGYGVRAGALKCGEHGPVDLRSQSRCPGLTRVTNVIDTTAAGDSFNAGYLAAYINSNSALECLRQGHELAAEVIQHRGAIMSLSE